MLPAVFFLSASHVTTVTDAPLVCPAAAPHRSLHCGEPCHLLTCFCDPLRLSAAARGHQLVTCFSDPLRLCFADPGYMNKKIKSFERKNSIREKGNFASCNSCKRLVPSRLHELHDSKFPFVSRIEFIRSKISNFSVHVSAVADPLRLTANGGLYCVVSTLSF